MANCPWSSFGWLWTWTHPFTASFCVKFQISWLKKVVLCLNDQKKNIFDLVAFTGLQNFQNKVRYAWWYQRKGPFLTSVLNIIKSNEVNKWFLDFFYHVDTEIHISVKNVRFDSIWAMEVGAPSSAINPFIPFWVDWVFTHKKLYLCCFWTNFESVKTQMACQEMVWAQTGSSHVSGVLLATWELVKAASLVTIIVTLGRLSFHTQKAVSLSF